MFKSLIYCFSIIALFGCAPEEKYPEAYGIYAWNGNAWVDISSYKTTISLNLPANTKILIHDKATDRVAHSFKLVSKSYIRNILHKDMNGSLRKTEPYHKWDLRDQSEAIDGKFYPVNNHVEMIKWSANTPLSPGVYEAQLYGESKDSFSVAKESFVNDIEDSNFCYDLIKTTWGGIRTGVADKYSPCAGDPNQTLLKMFQNNRSILEIKAVEKLLSRGANPNLNDDYNATTILQTAVDSGRADIVALLISKGAKVNLPSTNSSHDTVIYYAHDSTMVDILLKAGADIKYIDANGRTVLHKQYMTVEPKLVEYLIAKGAPLNIKDKFGRTSLDEAKITLNTLQKNKQNNISIGADGDARIAKAVEVVRILTTKQ